MEGGSPREAAAAMSFAARAAEGIACDDRGLMVNVGGTTGGGAGAGACACADCSIKRSGWNQCSTVVATSLWMTSMSIMKTMNLRSGTISPLGPTSIADGTVTTGSVATSSIVVSTAQLPNC